MRTANLILALVAGLLLLADMIHGSAARHWRDGEALIGMNLMRAAERVNPFSVSVRLDQIESLFTGYRKTRDARYLHEAVLISRGILKNYPGNVQANALYATALVLEATHGGSGYPLTEALWAAKVDPISVDAIDVAIFLISAKRHDSDYHTFKWLGAKRAALTHARMPMRCVLCGKHWLNH